LKAHEELSGAMSGPNSPFDRNGCRYIQKWEALSQPANMLARAVRGEVTVSIGQATNAAAPAVRGRATSVWEHLGRSRGADWRQPA
jgi:hypothetical protein